MHTKNGPEEREYLYTIALGWNSLCMASSLICTSPNHVCTGIDLYTFDMSQSYQTKQMCRVDSIMYKLSTATMRRHIPAIINDRALVCGADDLVVKSVDPR